MNSETTFKVFKALGDPNRLHIVEFLSSRCCGVIENESVEMPTAGEICCHVTGADKISANISHHLQELEAAGIVKKERCGKSVCCSLNAESLETAAAYLIELAKGERASCC
ncbi:hypothetical protein BH11ARM1_BH11ARM1_13180 [soil metagenome]